MNDILSQNEIDKLLNSLTIGEVDFRELKNKDRKIKKYDFKRPNVFAKDHIRTLNVIYDNYTKSITSFLTGYLRTLVQAEVVNVESLVYNDYNSSLSNRAILSIIEVDPLPGNILLEIQSKIANAFVDRALGGRRETNCIDKDYTEIELTIIRKIVEQIIKLMKEPWSNIISINPKLDRMETNTQFAQIMSPNEVVILVTLSVIIDGVEGLINICIPHMVVEPIVPRLSTKFWFSTSTNEKEITEETKKQIEYRVRSTIVPVKAFLGSIKLTVEEIVDLQIGDVLPLDTNANGKLHIMVGCLLKFKARLGVNNKKYAFKITDVVRGED